MTGGEIVPAAAGKAAAKALKNGDEVKSTLLELSKDGKTMALAAEHHARRIAIREIVKTKIYAPVRWMFGIRIEYFDTQFEEDLAAKLSDLTDDEIIEPKPNITAQAIQGLGYSLDEAELKEMYLNLIATASTRARASHAHPAFANFIMELTGEEAQYLREFLARPYEAMVAVHVLDPDDDSRIEMHVNVINFIDYQTNEPVPTEVAASWIDNWVRLGLVRVTYASEMGDRFYGWVESHPAYRRAEKYVEDHPDRGHTIEVERGSLNGTELGKKFIQAVDDDYYDEDAEDDPLMDIGLD